MWPMEEDDWSEDWVDDYVAEGGVFVKKGGHEPLQAAREEE